MAWCRAGTTQLFEPMMTRLTHWGRVTHICVGKLTIIGSDNGLSPDRRQAIIWTNDGIFLIGPLGTNFSEILIETNIFIQENAFESVVRKTAAILSRPQCVNKSIYRIMCGLSWITIFCHGGDSAMIAESLHEWQQIVILTGLQYVKFEANYRNL